MTIAAGLCLAAIASTSGAQGNGFPIFVKNPTTFDRVGDPVASGVSIPYNCPLYEPELVLKMVDQFDNPVPVQFKVLSRWGGLRDDTTKVVKWLLIEFPASVPAGGQSIYFLRVGPNTAGQITTQVTSTEVRVNTGPALFKIDKNAFTLFKEVSVGGQVVTGGPGALEIRNVQGQLVTVNLTSTAIEEQGSVRTVVIQKGNVTGMNLQFTCRSYFWTGRTDVKVDFRIENSGAYGEGLNYMGSATQHAYFEDLKISLPISDIHGSVTTSAFNRATAGAPYELRQDWSTPSNLVQMLNGFHFDELQNGFGIANGGRYDGALALNGSNGSILASVDRFWQNFPKAFECSGQKLSVALFPAFGFGPVYGGQYMTPTTPATDALSTSFYRFEGGRWKTHTIVFDFKPTGTFTPADVALAAVETQTPLMGLAQLPWNFQTFGFGAMVVERRPWTDVANNRFEKMMDVLAKDSAADFQDTLGKVGLPLFRDRGGTYGGDQMYGWQNFGDVAWGDGYSSLHYDLGWGVLINFYRTGDYAFFDMARDMIAHRRDYDQYHSKNSSSVRRGGQFYEKGFTHGNYTAPEPSHTWVHGLLSYYAMTGDEGAREAAIEVGAFVARMHPETWDGWWGSRILGWQLECLVHLWNYIGDPAYKSLAAATANRFKTLEVNNGSKGFVPNPAWTTPHEQTWMHCIVLSAMSKYYLATYDQNIVPCMTRMADWVLSKVILQQPSGPITACTLGLVWGRAADNLQQEPSLHHLWVTTDALSYSAICLGKPEYFAAASNLWQCVTRYHQEQAITTTTKNYNSSSSYSKIAFRMLMYPGAETKIMSNVALWGQAFPMAAMIWNGWW